MRRWLSRVSPLRLGLSISGVLVVALLTAETLLDRWPAIGWYAAEGALSRQSGGPLRDLRIAVVHCLLAGYLPAAFLAVVRGGRQTVLALQGALDCSREECEALAASVRFSPTWLGALALLGLTVGISGPYIVPPVPETPWNPATWSAEVTWHRMLGPVLAVGTALLAYSIAAVSRRMSRLASDLSSIDLLDLRPLLPFTQQGLVNALLLAGFIAIAGLMLLTEAGFGLLALLSGGPMLAATGLALVLPLRGVHGRIRKAKEAELARVDAELRIRVVTWKAHGADRRPGDFADLAAYRDLISGVQEWPASSSTYLRFALYLLIPVLSWAAAGLVEHLVDALVF